jgi:hypothetical protein
VLTEPLPSNYRVVWLSYSGMLGKHIPAEIEKLLDVAFSMRSVWFQILSM